MTDSGSRGLPRHPGSARTESDQPGIPTVKLVHPSHGPSRKELAEDLRVDATPEQLGKAVTRRVKVEFYKPKRHR